ncbi:MAG: DNA gyrase inhibitor YacG [Planctomycetes bacterium]|nr:DNA gyrase inhibitor YacG [Planctomycetota bacterium]
MPELLCPVCKERFRVDSDPAQVLQARPHFPFCSERCKMVDLGRWFQEDYAVSRPMNEDDLPDQLAEDLFGPA